MVLRLTLNGLAQDCLLKRSGKRRLVAAWLGKNILGAIQSPTTMQTMMELAARTSGIELRSSAAFLLTAMDYMIWLVMSSNGAPMNTIQVITAKALKTI